MAPIELDSLTDSEIRKKFSELGFPIGPVTTTTRKVLLSRLKTLLEEKRINTTTGDKNHAALQPSTVEEPSDGSSKSRRRSLPRSSNKSPKRRSPARSNVNTTQSDYIGENNLLNSSVSNGSKRPTRSSLLQDTTNYSHTSQLDNYESSRYLPEVNYFSKNSGTNALPTSTTSPRLMNSAINFGLNDTFRSRISDSNYDSDDLSVNQPDISYSSYGSDYYKRLPLRSTQRSEFRTPVGGIASKLLDVKESDDEDSGPPPVYAKFSHSGIRGSPVTNIKNIKRNPSAEGWLPFDSAISTILLLFFLLFFIVIGVTYINIHSPDTNLSSPSEMIFPVCLINVPSQVPGENCIREADKITVMRLFKIVYKELHDTLKNGACNGKKQEAVLFSDDDIVNMIVEHDKAMSVWVVEQHLKNLKVLFDANPKWKIRPNGQGIAVEEPQVSYYCYILNNVYIAVDWIFRIFLSCITLYSIYLLMKWWMMREARYKDDVSKLVTNIIEIVSSKAHNPESYIPIDHVRDQLILPKDRPRMNKLWKDAVAMLESDSRIRSEVQQFEGENFVAWRWLATSFNNSSKRKVWQGQAFDTMEGSVNSLPRSPTSCLKIRHMFDVSLEEGDDWVTTVVNAILEKCGEAKALHIVVDKQSREGCVYMKCASPDDAGIAYRALHGSWFDSKLVTVKYIREQRYLERFPDSANCTQPLQPSN